MSAFTFPMPNSNVILRKCSHCRQPGHRINVCREAYIDGNTHHEFLLEIIYYHLNSDNPDFTYIAVKSYLRNLTLRQLILITYVHQDINIFSYQLFHKNLITFDQAAMLLKRDIVTVLSYYYQTYYRNLEVEGYVELLPSVQRKFEVASSVLNLETTVTIETKFQCPICLEEVDDMGRITMNCSHKVCTSCFEKYLSSLQKAVLPNKKPSCCLCGANIASLTFKNEACCSYIKTNYLK